MIAFDRLGCWHEFLPWLYTLPNENHVVGHSLLSFWQSYGFHLGRSLGGMAELGKLLRARLPAYQVKHDPLILYRGELESRFTAGLVGMSWTEDIETARMFARRRCSGEGRGILLRTTALPSQVIAGPTPHSTWLQEGEYILDCERLQDIVRLVP